MNRAIQKSISIFLTVMLVLAMVPLTVLVGADGMTPGNYQTLSVGEVRGVTVTPQAEYEYFSFTPDTDGTYAFFSLADCDTVGCIRDAQGNELIYDDDSGTDNNFKVCYTLSAGTTYILCAGLYDKQATVSFGVSVKKLVPATQIMLSADGLSGYIGEESVLTYQLNVEDAIPEVVTWNSDNPAVATVDENGRVEYIAAGTAVISVTTESGLADSCLVEVSEYPIDHLELIKGPDYSYYENSGGEWVTYWNPVTGQDETYYRYYLNFSGLTIRVYFPDGSYQDAGISDSVRGMNFSFDDGQDETHWMPGSENVLTVSLLEETLSVPITISESPIASLEIIQRPSELLYENSTGNWVDAINPETQLPQRVFIYNMNFWDMVIRIHYPDGSYRDATLYENVDGNWFSVSDNQYTSPWTVGGTNPVTITLLGRSVIYPAVIQRTPISSLELIKAPGAAIYENETGRWETTFNYETQQMETYFNYIVDYSDMVIRVHYPDGSQEDKTVSDSVSGSYFAVRDHQTEQHWTPGSNNFVTVSVLGKELTIPITIVENPVESISLDSAPAKEYTQGDETYGYWSGNDFFFDPSDLTGLVFTVHYKDGTQKQFCDNDIQNRKIEGHDITVTCENAMNPEPGEIPVTLTFCGSTLSYNVQLNPSPVQSVQMTKAPTVTRYANGFQPDFLGAEFLITYQNGTTETVAVTKDNLIYHWEDYSPWPSHRIRVGDYYLCLSLREVDPTIYETAYFASFLGQRCRMDCFEFYDAAVTGIKMLRFSPDGEEMQVRISYEDGTTEDLLMQPLSFFPNKGMATGFAKTEKGILDYFYSAQQDSQSTAMLYTMNLLNQSDIIRVGEPLLGDVNNDGTLNLKDVVCFKKHTVGSDTVFFEELADINSDGVCNGQDLALIQAKVMKSLFRI